MNSEQYEKAKGQLQRAAAFDELLDGLRRERGLPAKVSNSNPRWDEGSASPTVAKSRTKLKRLSAAHRLAENPEARAAAEAFRNAMRGGK